MEQLADGVRAASVRRTHKVNKPINSAFSSSPSGDHSRPLFTVFISNFFLLSFRLGLQPSISKPAPPHLSNQLIFNFTDAGITLWPPPPPSLTLPPLSLPTFLLVASSGLSFKLLLLHCFFSVHLVLFFFFFFFFTLMYPTFLFPPLLTSTSLNSLLPPPALTTDYISCKHCSKLLSTVNK